MKYSFRQIYSWNLIVLCLVLCLIFANTLSFCQENTSSNNLRYKACAKEFYRLFYNRINNLKIEPCNCLPDDFPFDSLNNKSKLTTLFQQLTDGLPMDSVAYRIDHSEVVDFGSEFSICLELKISSSNKVRIDFNMDSPTQCEFVWLNNGDCVAAVLLGEEKFYGLHRIGIIEDIDGFVNVRKAANKESEIVGKILANEIFYYIPVEGQNWWKVSKKDNLDFMGYIYRKKIVPFDKFPKKLKDKARINHLMG